MRRLLDAALVAVQWVRESACLVADVGAEQIPDPIGLVTPQYAVRSVVLAVFGGLTAFRLLFSDFYFRRTLVQAGLFSGLFSGGNRYAYQGKRQWAICAMQGCSQAEPWRQVRGRQRGMRVCWADV